MVAPFRQALDAQSFQLESNFQSDLVKFMSLTSTCTAHGSSRSPWKPCIITCATTQTIPAATMTNLLNCIVARTKHNNNTCANCKQQMIREPTPNVARFKLAQYNLVLRGGILHDNNMVIITAFSLHTKRAATSPVHLASDTVQCGVCRKCFEPGANLLLADVQSFGQHHWVLVRCSARFQASEDGVCFACVLPSH